jgi:hypothetical protein
VLRVGRSFNASGLLGFVYYDILLSVFGYLRFLMLPMSGSFVCILCFKSQCNVNVTFRSVTGEPMRKNGPEALPQSLRHYVMAFWAVRKRSARLFLLLPRVTCDSSLKGRRVVPPKCRTTFARLHAVMAKHTQFFQISFYSIELQMGFYSVAVLLQ